MQDRIFFLGALGFAGGILIASLTTASLGVAGFALLIGVLFLRIYAAVRRRAYTYFAIVVLLAALGIARVWGMPNEAPPELLSRMGSETTVEGIVRADPDIRETTQRIVIDTEEGRILAVAYLYPEVSYGERVRVTGTLARPEPFDTDGGRVFQYDRFLAKDGIFVIVERASVEIIEGRSGVWEAVRGTLSDLKRGFLSSLAAALPEPHAALAGGLVAGGKQGLGENLLDAFIVSGLVHIVVLSAP